MDNVWKKLNFIQCKLNAPKNQKNSFGNYNFRSNEDILEALKPLLDEVGAIVIQSDQIKVMAESEKTVQFTNDSGGYEVLPVSRVYVEATSSFICCDTGESIENKASAREAIFKKGMDDAQVTGSASSYARKYSLNGLFAIDDSKDPDSTNKHGKDDDGNQGGSMPPQNNQPDLPWLNDITKLVEVANQNGWNGEQAVKEARKTYAVSRKTADEIKKALS